MNELDEDVRYFLDLVKSNITLARTKERKKAAAVFHNVNVRLDGEEVAIFNTEKDYSYIRAFF